MSLTDIKDKYTHKELLFKEHNRKKLRRVRNYYNGQEAHTNFFYGFLCLIYDGFTNIETLKQEMRVFFISSTHQLVPEDTDVEEYLQIAEANDLIILKNNKSVDLTEKGKEYVEFTYLDHVHISKWMRIFYSEKTVVLSSAVFLIIFSLLKIIVGIQLSSEGMLTEGFENLTDLIKTAIIFFVAMKLGKDKLASSIIICLMLFTGAALGLSSITALINTEPITPTIQAFIIATLSIILNAGLMFLKGWVGRISSNLSLISDSKDSKLNMELSIGVIIGLTFAIFRYYFIDAIIGIIISILIFKEGIEFLIEVSKKEDNFDIRNLKVPSDKIYENRLTGYILTNIRRDKITSRELLNNLKKGLNLGRKYYLGFADFFYDGLNISTAERHLNKLNQDGYVTHHKEGQELLLTRKGLKAFYQVKGKEFKHRAAEISVKTKIRSGPIICLGLIILLILLFLYADIINSFLLSI
ncbi:MAG: hypothetical protein EU550_01075 [Promethearchaeota archaeon]|nr:MAG: hypothetical protein EU550_01075 [Candidatus Lokiarchaeota archaeon]